MVAGVRPTGHHDILAEGETLGGHAVVKPAAVGVVATVGADIDMVLGLAEQASEGIGRGTVDGGLHSGSEALFVKGAGADDHLVVLGGRVGVHPVGRQARALGSEGEVARSAALLTLQGDGPVLIEGGILSHHTHGVRRVHGEVIMNAGKRIDRGGPIRRRSIISIDCSTRRLGDSAREGGNLLGGEVVDGNRHAVALSVDNNVATRYTGRSGDADASDGALVTLGAERRHAHLAAVLVLRAVGHDDQLVVGGVGGEAREVDGRHTGLGGAEDGGGLGGLIIYDIGGVFVARVGPAQRGTVAGDIRGSSYAGDVLTSRDGLDRDVVDIPSIVVTAAAKVTEGDACIGGSVLKGYLRFNIGSTNVVEALYSHKCAGILDICQITYLETTIVAIIILTMPETHLQGVGGGIHLGQDNLVVGSIVGTQMITSAMCRGVVYHSGVTAV